MEFFAKPFEELTPTELYEILKSRIDIFVLEQGIVYQDLDDMDKQCLHCFFMDGKRVTACLRAYLSGKDTVTIGRVITLNHRQGLGSALMEESIKAIQKHFPCQKITLHSQVQALGFYQKLGFTTTSEEFLEQGVPHITVEKKL